MLLSFSRYKKNPKVCVDISEIAALIETADEQTIVLVDIDDTIITPKSANTSFIDELKSAHKNDPAEYPHFEEMISIWRLEREAKLVCAKWPSIIKACRDRGVSIYGLTQMDIGKIGYIESMPTWRYTELKTMGIQFTPTYQEKKVVTAFKKPSGERIEAKFFYGIFMSPGPKDAIVQQILSFHPNINRVIFIDDRIDHVEAVKAACNNFANVSYQGIFYRGVDAVRGEPNVQINALQKELLSQANPRWFEDEDAQRILQENNTLNENPHKHQNCKGVIP